MAEVEVDSRLSFKALREMRSTKGLSVDPEETRSEDRVPGMSMFRGQEDEEEIVKGEKTQRSAGS